MFKVKNKDTRTTSLWCRSGVFIVNFEHVSHLALVFLLLTLNIYLPAGKKKSYCCSFSDSKFRFSLLPFFDEIVNNFCNIDCVSQYLMNMEKLRDNLIADLFWLSDGRSSFFLETNVISFLLSLWFSLQKLTLLSELFLLLTFFTSV